MSGQEAGPSWGDWWRFYVLDHQIVREPWWNLSEVSPGVWRANQPGLRQLRHYRNIGIRTIVSLRGARDACHNRIETHGTSHVGLSLVHSPGLLARDLVPSEVMLRVVDDIEAAEKPLLIHCKSGADRTGLAAALYLILVEGVPVSEATLQLGPSYIHFHRSDAGVLSHLFRVFLRDAAPKGTDFRSWLTNEYDARAVTADFTDWRQRRGRWG